MARDIEREIRRFARRVRLGRFLGASAQALAALAVAAAAALVVLRLIGGAWLPEPAWFALLLVPAFLWGLRAAMHTGFGRSLSAAHLDRRLGMEGLLISALERDPEGYRGRIFERLGAAHAALPHVRPRPLLTRVLVAAAVVGLLFVLPAPEIERARASPLAAEALEEFEARLEEREDLDEEVRQEISKRISEMQDRLGSEGDVSWTDLDKLERKLENERALQVARLAKAMQDLEAFARGEDPEAQGGEAAARERMQQLLEAAGQAGLLDELPASLRERLGLGEDRQGDGGAGDGTPGSELDEEALKQLAAALADSAGEALEGLDAGELLEDFELGDLELAELAELVEGEPCKLCEGEHDEDCPG